MEATMVNIAVTSPSGESTVSVDSGFHPRSPASDTDDEISEAFSSSRNVLTPTNTSRTHNHETDNLVEEVYFAQNSLCHIEGKSKYVTNELNNNDEGTYHASPYLMSGEGEDLTKRNHAKVTHCEDINISNRSVKEDKFKTCLPSTASIPSNPLICDEKQQTRHYVNQCELKSKIKRIPISEGVIGDVKGGNVEVVVAIDLGTTYSGYAYCYAQHEFDKEVHVMRRWEGGDPGLNNQKMPTTLLVTPDGLFHSFGLAARDHYHDLEPQDAQKWFYFDKFKKTLHNNANVNPNTKVAALNGRLLPAVEVFGMALHHLSSLALAELADQSGGTGQAGVRWVVTVPALWGHGAKQLMREAAHKAGICSNERPESLLIALEPEAAAVWCKNLRFDQIEGKQLTKDHYQQTSQGTCFIVVDCGGGTVDVTVHKLHEPRGPLRELYKASGEPCGSLGIDEEFDKLLGTVFGFSFMSQLKIERPAAYTELMLSFESRKRSLLPSRTSPLNVSLPFAFIDFFQNVTGKKVAEKVAEFGDPRLSWSPMGMLRLSPQLMTELFHSTVDNIVKHLEGVLTTPEVSESSKFVFLVGGFAESVLLQNAIRKKLCDLNIPPPIIPQGVALCVLKGAVLYGLNPQVVMVRKAQHTYGVGVLKPFQRDHHPVEKLVLRDSREWCADVFDVLVTVNQNLYAGESVLRRYTPANPSQNVIILHIYCTDQPQPKFVTDEGVQRIGTLKLDLSSELGRDKPREILTRLIFSSTELTVSAMDLETASYTDTSLTFVS